MIEEGGCITYNQKIMLKWFFKTTNTIVISVNVKHDLLSSFNHLFLIGCYSYVHGNKTIEILNEEGNVC
jgi:hypothetical protein